MENVSAAADANADYPAFDPEEDQSNIMENANNATAGTAAAAAFVFAPEEDPLSTLRTIQSLLNSHSSDAVRQHLKGRGVLVDDIDGRRHNDITPGDVLDSPFFLMKGLSQILPHMQQQQQPETETEERHISGDVSKTAREILADFFSFNVNFEAWTTFTADTAFVGDLPSNPTGYRTWGRLLIRMLDQTFRSRITTTGEIKELSVLEQQLNSALEPFGFHFNLVTGSGGAYNFEINETEKDGELNEVVIIGVGKESGMLPRLCTEYGQELCLFGFATKIFEAQSSRTKGWHTVSATET